MTPEEMKELLTQLNNLDFKSLPFEESLIMISATIEFCNKIKPILVKYAMENDTPSNSTFLFKL